MRMFGYSTALSLIFLIQTVLAIYSTSPIVSFKVVDPASLFYLPTIKLSPSGDKFAISFLNITDLSLQFKIMTLGGKEQCKMQHQNSTRYFIAWPPQSGLMFLSNDNITINRYTSQCDQLQKFVKFKKRPEKIAYTLRSNDPFVAFCVQDIHQVQMIQEYNIRTKQQSNKFIGLVNENVKSLMYSDNGKLLCMSESFQTYANETIQDKIIARNTETNELEFQIITALQPRKVLESGYSFLGIINNTLTKIDHINNTQLLRIFIIFPSDQLEVTQIEGNICTSDNVFVTVKFTNLLQKVELIIYSTENGQEVQKIQLDFIPVIMANPLTVNKLVECNDDSLILLGADGVVRIFHYSYSHRLPLWAIVLICVTVLAIVVAVVIFICKRKNKRKEQNKFGKYSSLLE